ncbi:type II and III secretion system protein family protein [Roseicyclus persicicus]|uniref:Type II and III secretion system protein family protein n=1 Tax=Roseicyclus persicicus TaxID=2650661 RepID=A0A7X6GXI5_9RHOB|nr:type II and III secretion system protein family protein [Roseibacterium persicicum]NKX44191.1 type II and III secretion system protein family protein [Roseibacterium persicicum]
MSLKHFLRACVVGCALAVIPAAGADAQGLRVVEGQTSATLSVPMNRAVVVESDLLFAEISVANPSIADIATLSERTIYVLGRAPGRTTMTLLGADGALIANIEVQVVPDVAELRERLREILRGEQIEVRTANDGIVLSGTVSSGRVVERAMELADRYAPGRVSNLMLVGGSQQVMLQVRFAEMSRTVRQELGVRLGLTEDAGGTGSTFSGSSAPPSGVLSVASTFGNVRMNIMLEALETEGLVRTLAEPNLTALSGQTASFLAGGEFPVPTRDEDGSVAVQFQPFGVELEFTPTVVDDDIINLSLGATVSSIDAEIPGNESGLPGLRTREASTTVELRDGESFAIAGLLQDDFRDSIGQVPWLGDLPVLGALFRSASYQREQSELVIIVTAHMVTPVRGEALALPTDRVTIPTANQLFLQGRLYGTPQAGAAGDVARQDFSGSYGYVME